jgi:hypothetical protein
MELNKKRGEKMTEAILQKTCESLLKKKNIKFITRFNENLFKRNRGIRKDLKGCPDLICFMPNGRLIAIELKAPEKYIAPEMGLSDDQKEWRDYFIKNSYEWYCVDSFIEFKKIIKNI